MHHGSPPPTTPPREQRQPLAVVTPKRKRTARGSPTQAAIRVLPTRAARPVRPSAPRRQIPAPPAALWDSDDYALKLLAQLAVAQADAAAAAAAAPPAPAAKNLHAASPPLPPAAADDEEKEKPYDAPPLPPLAVAHQNPSSMSIDHGYGDASPKPSAAAPPAPAPASKNLRSSPPLPLAAAADEENEKSCDAPPLPPLVVDEPQSAMSMDHDHAASKAIAEDCKKVAFPSQGNAGSSKGDQHGGGVASPAAGGGASPMQLDGDGEQLEPGEIPAEKLAAGRNADSARGSILGKYKPPVAWEPTAMGSSAHRAAPAAEMFAAMEKRRREVFVGGLSRDAVEEDVRAALSPAGEITQVRMFVDRLTNKNKGYCFVAYRDAAMARKAVAELVDVKICGKQCRVAVPAGNEKTNKNAQRDPTIEDYNSIYGHRQGVHSSYITSWDPHAASYVVPPVVSNQAGYYYPMYHNGNIIFLPASDLNHGLPGPSGRSQMGQSAGSGRRPAGHPHRSRN